MPLVRGHIARKWCGLKVLSPLGPALRLSALCPSPPPDSELLWGRSALFSSECLAKAPSSNADHRDSSFWGPDSFRSFATPSPPSPRRTSAFLIGLPAIRGPLLSCQVVEASKGLTGARGSWLSSWICLPRQRGRSLACRTLSPYLPAGPGAAQLAKTLRHSQLPVETEPRRPGQRLPGG